MNNISLISGLFLILGTLSWYRPTAGIALALNAHVFRTWVQSQALGAEVQVGQEHFLWSAAIIIPSLGPVLLRTWVTHNCRNVKAKSPGVHLCLPDIGIAAIAFVALLGCMYAPDVGAAFSDFIMLGFLGLSFYVLGRVAFRDMPEPIVEIHKLLTDIWILALISALLALLDFDALESIRLSTEGSNPIPFSLLIGMALLISSYWLLVKNAAPAFTRPFILVIMILFLFCFVAANTRGPMIFCSIAFFFFCIGIAREGHRPVTIIYILVLAIAIFISLDYLTHYFPAVFERWWERVDGLVDPDQSIIGRQNYIEIAVQQFVDNPLLGRGTGTMEAIHGVYAHNIFADVAAEYGLIGLMALGMFVAGLTFRIFSTIRGSDNQLCVLIAVICIYFLLHANVSQRLPLFKHLYFFSGLLVFLYGHGYTRREARPKLSNVMEIRIPEWRNGHAP